MSCRTTQDSATDESIRERNASLLTFSSSQSFTPDEESDWSNNGTPPSSVDGHVLHTNAPIGSDVTVFTYKLYGWYFPSTKFIEEELDDYKVPDERDHLIQRSLSPIHKRVYARVVYKITAQCLPSVVYEKLTSLSFFRGKPQVLRGSLILLSRFPPPRKAYSELYLKSLICISIYIAFRIYSPVEDRLKLSRECWADMFELQKFCINPLELCFLKMIDWRVDISRYEWDRWNGWIDETQSCEQL
ncbi:hypothetical protein NEOLI_000859 [Neolecta irregularis DAH-3]|uniref:Uncharacterized protein n=1 Tax=Neolecta irregularis (strain DAH-3) TaxID=1198029 RepID=A0A1U7LKV3_NEOID|nr:hypothetical protein NEOLI_000859 [Neolecta irregularis DAH-3]|eukprot:OLL23269.1 hypothetical protein NEOLI_000859 [Neolecta irregularis DAH-3]